MWSTGGGKRPPTYLDDGPRQQARRTDVSPMERWSERIRARSLHADRDISCLMLDMAHGTTEKYDANRAFSTLIQHNEPGLFAELFHLYSAKRAEKAQREGVAFEPSLTLSFPANWTMENWEAWDAALQGVKITRVIVTCAGRFGVLSADACRCVADLLQRCGVSALRTESPLYEPQWVVQAFAQSQLKSLEISVMVGQAGVSLDVRDLHADLLQGAANCSQLERLEFNSGLSDALACISALASRAGASTLESLKMELSESAPPAIGGAPRPSAAEATDLMHQVKALSRLQTLAMEWGIAGGIDQKAVFMDPLRGHPTLVSMTVEWDDQTSKFNPNNRHALLDGAEFAVTCPALTELHFLEADLVDDPLVALEKCKASGNTVSDADVLTRLRTVFSSPLFRLKSWTVSHDILTIGSMTALSEALIFAGFPVESLHIRCCYMNRAGARPLSEALGRITHLRKIRIPLVEDCYLEDALGRVHGFKSRTNDRWSDAVLTVTPAPRGESQVVADNVAALAFKPIEKFSNGLEARIARWRRERRQDEIGWALSPHAAPVLGASAAAQQVGLTGSALDSMSLLVVQHLVRTGQLSSVFSLMGARQGVVEVEAAEARALLRKDPMRRRLRNERAEQRREAADERKRVDQERRKTVAGYFLADEADGYVASEQALAVGVIKNGDAETLRVMLGLGLALNVVNVRDENLLLKAARDSGSSVCWKFLVAHGAIDFGGKLASQAPPAAAQSSVDVWAQMGYGARARESFHAALDALVRGDLDAFKDALYAGAPLDLVDSDGANFLMMAAVLAQRPDFVKFLLHRGAEDIGGQCRFVAGPDVAAEFDRFARPRAAVEGLPPGYV